ncbi:MAG: class I SAM-dependent methyltransferase [Parcubacteria group bacterium]|nr:class I SAM-dependent methyltransferase [Parcubacteria group bacterium]
MKSVDFVWSKIMNAKVPHDAPDAVASGERARLFDEIYKKHKWLFGSGTGSIAALNRPYITFINTILKKHTDIRTVVDIGCGDWQIGRNLELGDREYIGCDVSRFILEKTKAKFSAPKRQFIHLDAVTDELPDGDLVIVRDVLQHLSHKEVGRVLSKLEKYKYVIIQNDIRGGGTKNRDIQTGEFRPLDITAPPFNSGRYRLTFVYTSGWLKIANPLIGLLHVSPLLKGVFTNLPNKGVDILASEC